MFSRGWLWPSALAVLGLAFALAPLAQGDAFIYWDNSQQHFPALVFLSRSLAQGILPLWWPEVMAGFPLVAEGQAAHFHPIHVALAWLLPPPAAFMLESGLAFAVAGLGMYAFLRLFPLNRAACGFGAFIYMFSSLAMALVKNAASMRAACLFPLVLYFAERLVRRRRAIDGAGLAVVIGLQLLAGYPTPALIAVAAAGFHITWRTVQLARWKRTAVTRDLALNIAVFAIFVVLGGAIAGIQLVPTAKHVPASIRQTGLDRSGAASYLASNPRHWLQWTVPYAVHPLRPATNQDEASGRGGSWFYMGALAPGCLLAALCWRRRRTHVVWPLAGGAALSALLAIGGRTPILPWLLRLPVLDSFRYPSRILYWTSFACAALGAFGLNHLMAHPRTGQAFPRRLLLIWIAGLAASAGAALAAGTGITPVGVSMLFAGIAVLGTALLVAAPRRRRALALALLLATVVLDIGVFRFVVRFARPVPIAQATAPPPIASWLQQDADHFRVLALRSAPPAGATWDQEAPGFLSGPGGTVYGLEGMRTNFSLPFSLPLILGERVEDWVTEHPDRLAELGGLLGAMNIKYVLAWRDASAAGWPLAATEGNVSAWRNPGFLPRAFLVGRAQQAPPLDPADRPEALRWARRNLNYLGNPDAFLDVVGIVERHLRAPIDMSATAVLETDVLPQLSGLGSVHTVVTRDTPPDLLAYDVQTDRPALLYMSVMHGPGWSATVNGAPTPLLRANWIGTAVQVPAGASIVELRYSLPGLGEGAALSAAGLLVLAGILVLRLRSRHGDAALVRHHVHRRSSGS